MSSEAQITIRHVSKLFFKQEQKTFKEFLPAFFTGKKTREWFWALQDIDLTIQPGESVGITGPNGSGKSTLLKLIAGVTTPTKGTLTVQGKIAPLVELGAGFHPELTGRENVYLNGVILGLSREQVAARFAEIVAFAELGEFIDVPVKHYSSGMYLRLAFSVAVHTDPDILLIDEILAVGDVNFQKKCIQVVKKMQINGCVVILVSHDRRLINEICKKTYEIVNGRIRIP